jgi:RND family efflux transporter MFP subunit
MIMHVSHFNSTSCNTNVPENRLFNYKTLLLGVFTVGILMNACSQSVQETNKPDTSSIEIRPDVIFARTSNEPLQIYLESQGAVEPIRDLTIQPRISGFIGWHQITDGKRVEKGDTLLMFVSDEWRLRLAEARNTLNEAAQKLDIEQQLRSRDTNRSPLTDAEIRNLEQQFGLAQARLALERAELEYSYTALIAPFDGVIHTTLNVSNGAYVNVGTPLGQLLDHDRVRVKLDVLESELAKLRTGMDVQISSPTGFSTTGRVSTISPLINRDRKTGLIIVEVSNESQHLTTGMTVNGKIITQVHHGRVRAPRAALLERDGRTLVFKLNENADMVEWVYVDPVIVTPEYIMLNEEVLTPGDMLAVDRHFALSHQQKVNILIRD